MADLPLEGRDSPTLGKPDVDLPRQKQIQVTMENYGPIAVHYLQLIYGRLGYIIKLLEGGKHG